MLLHQPTSILFRQDSCPPLRERDLTSFCSVLAEPGPDNTLRTTAPDHLSPRTGRLSGLLSWDSRPPEGLQPDTRMARDLRERGGIWEEESSQNCNAV